MGTAVRGSAGRSWRGARGSRQHRLSAGCRGRPPGCGNRRVLGALQLSVEARVICNPKAFSRFVSERRRAARGPPGRAVAVPQRGGRAGCHPPPAKRCLPQPEVKTPQNSRYFRLSRGQLLSRNHVYNQQPLSARFLFPPLLSMWQQPAAMRAEDISKPKALLSYSAFSCTKETFAFLMCKGEKQISK